MKKAKDADALNFENEKQSRYSIELSRAIYDMKLSYS